MKLHWHKQLRNTNINFINQLLSHISRYCIYTEISNWKTFIYSQLLFEHLLLFPIRKTFQVDLHKIIFQSLLGSKISKATWKWNKFTFQVRQDQFISSKRHTFFTSASHAVNSGRLFLHKTNLVIKTPKILIQNSKKHWIKNYVIQEYKSQQDTKKAATFCVQCYIKELIPLYFSYVIMAKFRLMKTILQLQMFKLYLYLLH